MAVTPTALELQRREEAFEYLASKWPKRYNLKGTEYLRGLMEALSTGDGYIKAQTEAVRDNLISVTASGRYLDRRGGLYGVVRGQGTGVLDEDFRDIIPVLGLSPKQVSHVMLQLIDIIYGPLASHANATSAEAEPYALEEGFTLLIRVDDTEVEVEFETDDFSNINAATAEELAIVITNKTDGRVVGSVILDARTGDSFLNLRTSTIGSQGFLQILGGDAQTKLQFPQVRPVTNTIATWDVTRYGGGPEIQYTVTAGVPPDLSAANVSRGDLVTIRSDSGFDEKNTGTFEVTFVGSGYFRVSNGDGVPETGITQSNIDDFTFYDPDLGNILLTNRPAAVIETNPRELIVILPVTSPIVKRTLYGGHHFHQGLTTATATTATTISLGSSTGFDSTGGTIHPTMSRRPSRGIVSSIVGTTVTLIDGQNWPTKGSFKAANVSDYFFFDGRSGNTLTGVTPTPTTDLVGAEIKYNELYKYTSIVADVATGVFPDPTGLENHEVTAAGANLVDLTDKNFKGSFLYDSTAQFIASENATTIKETIRQGENRTLLLVDNVSDFDDEGYFVLEFNTEWEEGPIRYLTKVGDGSLIIDPSHIFETDHLEGTTIRMIRTIGPYTPRTDGRDLAVYTTSTSPARDLLASYLRLIAASGVILRFEIRVPDQKWPVLPNLFTTDPLDTELVTV
jgi:hypothetical protein